METIQISEAVWGVVTLFVLVGLGVYVVFAGVVVRQVKLMTDTLEVGFEMPIRLFSLILLVVSIAMFLYALVSL